MNVTFDCNVMMKIRGEEEEEEDEENNGCGGGDDSDGGNDGLFGF